MRYASAIEKIDCALYKVIIILSNNRTRLFNGDTNNVFLLQYYWVFIIVALTVVVPLLR